MERVGGLIFGIVLLEKLLEQYWLLQLLWLYPYLLQELVQRLQVRLVVASLLRLLVGAIGGAISGAVIGAGVSIVSQGVVNGYSNIDWKQVGAATVSGLVSGAISGAIFGLIGASVRGIKILNASRKGLVIGKMGNFEQAAKSMNLSHYNGLKGYKLVEKFLVKI